MSDVVKKRGRPKKDRDVKPQIVHTDVEIQNLLSGTMDKNTLKQLIGALFLTTGAAKGGSEVNKAVAESVTRSFVSYKHSLDNYIVHEKVKLRVTVDKKNSSSKSVNSAHIISDSISKSTDVNIGTNKYIPGKPQNIINAEFFTEASLISKRPLNELGEKYKDYDLMEYKYNVANLVNYYVNRFPDILDLFDVFSDICMSKSDIGVSIELSDEFLKSFFLDLFKKKLIELKKQSMAVPEETETIEEVPPEEESTTEEIPEEETTTEPATESDNFNTLLKSNSLNSISPNITSPDGANKIKVYDEIYTSVVNKYRKLLGRIEREAHKVLDSKTIKKMKYACKVSDIYGYCVVAIHKETLKMEVYNPTQVKLYKRKDSNSATDDFIFAKIEDDSLRVLNQNYDCQVFSLDPMVMLPIPNIVKISWYLYLLDLVEILIIYNDLLKSKTIHLLQVPVFDSANRAVDDDANDNVQNVTDSLALMNMIINNIESKLVMDTDYLKNTEGSEDIAMRLLKNVGLSIAYVPKLSENTRIDNIRLDTPNQDYEKLYTLLIDKIFAVLRFPTWLRTSSGIMANFKTIPREIVQFGHLIFMARVDGALSEIEELMEFVILENLSKFEISYSDSNKVVIPTFEKVDIKLKNMLEDYLFDRQVSETVRQTKISNVLSMVSSGLELNPEWIIEYIFPEYTPAEMMIQYGNEIEAKQQEIKDEVDRGYEGEIPTGGEGESGGNFNVFQNLFGGEGKDSQKLELEGMIITTDKGLKVDTKKAKQVMSSAMSKLKSTRVSKTSYNDYDDDDDDIDKIIKGLKDSKKIRFKIKSKDRSV